MGLFDKLFSGSNGEKEDANTPWKNLDLLTQLDEIVEQSKNKTQLIFKHSTRCGISRMVISQFKKDYNLNDTQADLYYLDLLNHRNISAAIADRFQVVHESPQLLVIKNGVVVKHASHGAINDMALENII